MTTELRRIRIEDLQAVTGTGPQKTRRLVREGILPGQMYGRDYVCSPGEFDRWYRGEWTAPTKNTENVTPLIHTRKAS